MTKRNHNLTDEQKEQLSFCLDELDALGVHPLHFLVQTVRAETALRTLVPQSGHGRPSVISSPDLLVKVLSRMVREDREDGGSPWQAPSVQTALLAWRFQLPALAEILRKIAEELDPAQVRPGRPSSSIDLFRKASATMRLSKVRWRIDEARVGRASGNDPRVVEALEVRRDLGLSKPETVALLAFAEHTGFVGPLADVDVDEAVRYFDAARKWKKPRGSVPQRSARGLARYAHMAGRKAAPKRKEGITDAEAESQRRTPPDATETRPRPGAPSARRSAGPRLDGGIPPAARGRRDGAAPRQDREGRHLPAEPPRGVDHAQHDRPERGRPATRRKPAGGLKKGKEPP